MADRNARAEDDEVLSALLDGALAEDEAKRLCDRLASDPALAARLEALRGVDAAVRQAYGPIADEPVPQRVLALLPIPAGAETWRPVPPHPAGSAYRPSSPRAWPWQPAP